MSSSRTLGLSLALLVLTFVAYWPVTHAGFVWDDDQHFVENHAIISPHGLKPIWTSFVLPVYYPLTFTVFWLIYQLAGPNPLPYHMVTLTLHAVNAILLLFLLRRLRVRGAWVVAVLWAIHPANVESVAWATELKNTLSGAWFFASLLCFLRYERELMWKWFIGALLCFAAALLSKSSTVMLPAVLLLCAWWQRERVRRSDVVRTLPFFALSLAASFVAVGAQVKEKVLQGAARDWSLRLPERLIVTGKDLWFYASKAVCPVNLMFVYPRWSHDARMLTEWLPLAGVVATGIILWRFRRTGPGRAATFALGYFVIALSPVLGFFDQYFYRYSFVADHFQYLAGIGIIALVVAAVTTVSQRAGQQAQYIRALATAIVLLILGACTWRQACIFQDVQTLWSDTLTKNPDAWLAHLNLGAVLSQQGRMPEAVSHWEEALRIHPNAYEAHFNLGLNSLQLGRPQEAMDHWEEALRIRADYPDAQNNLAWFLATRAESGNPVRAVMLAERACELTHNRKPDFLDTLAVAYAAAGRFDDAVATAQRAVFLARSNGNAELAGEIETRLQLYRSGRAYRPSTEDTNPAKSSFLSPALPQ